MLSEVYIFLNISMNGSSLLKAKIENYYGYVDVDGRKLYENGIKHITFPLSYFDDRNVRVHVRCDGLVVHKESRCVVHKSVVLLDV